MVSVLTSTIPEQDKIYKCYSLLTPTIRNSLIVFNKKYILNKTEIIFYITELEADAKKITQCLEANGQTIVNVIVDYYNQTTICFNPSLKAVLMKVGPLITDLDKVDSTVQILGVEVSKCGNDICVLGVSFF